MRIEFDKDTLLLAEVLFVDMDKTYLFGELWFMSLLDRRLIDRYCVDNGIPYS